MSDLCFSSLPLPLHHRHSISLHPFSPHTFWFCSSLSPPPGKILFRRSHVRDVAMKRLRFIDDYCRVKRPFCQHPSVPHLTVGKVPPPPPLPCLLGVKGHSPHCPFTCSKHRVHRVAVTRRSCVYELFWDMCRVCNMHWHLSFVSHWRAQLGDVIFCCDSWGVVYLPVCHSHRRRAT